jgi:hypothetical protein
MAVIWGFASQRAGMSIHLTGAGRSARAGNDEDRCAAAGCALRARHLARTDHPEPRAATTQDAALLELTYIVKRGQHPAAVDDAFGRLFTTVDGVVSHGQQTGQLPHSALGRARVLLFATI